VILDSDGVVVSAGAHRAVGMAHAEREAIGDLRFPGHTMVVTLEPCDHAGRTPPCTEAIIAAGIERVIIGVTDPDPRVSGRGVDRLRASGIDVVTDVAPALVEANDPGYFHHRRTGRARVTLKLATTLDGNVAARDGSSRWITGDEARRDVHRLRAQHDAVMVGAGTAITDDPELTVRLDGWTGPQPRPVVVAGRRDLPDSLRAIQRDALVYRAPAGADLDAALRDLPDHGILSVLVEGGPTLATSLLNDGLVDEVVWYVAGAVGLGVGIPAFVGEFETIADLLRLEVRDVTRLGDDVRITGSIRQERG
jgi:diaminohydroxyphosphoribosylaminopyrimidine deaminase/5-amino-6-(5-phosphoribosylamino)uracil reductase